MHCVTAPVSVELQVPTEVKYLHQPSNCVLDILNIYVVLGIVILLSPKGNTVSK